MKAKLASIFPDYRIVLLSAEEIMEAFDSLIVDGHCPTISLDRVYTDRGHYFRWTRIADSQKTPIGHGSRSGESISDQIERIVQQLPPGQHIQLVDDVVFSGDNIIDVVKLFNQAGVKVGRIVAAVSIGDGKENILTSCSEDNPGLKIHSAIHLGNVIDEVCERDFYPGVPLSGRLVGRMINGEPVPDVPEMGASYVHPFGDVEKWASIPPEKVREWSLFCLHQSIDLWRTIQLVSSRVVYNRDIDRRPLGWNNDMVPILSTLQLAVDAL